MRGKHVMASPFSLNGFTFAVCIFSASAEIDLLISIYFRKTRFECTFHFSPQSCVGGAENWVLPVCFLEDAYLRTSPSLLPTRRRQQEIAIA